MRSMLRETERNTPSFTESNGRPTNCATSSPGSAQRTWIEPEARMRTVCPVVGIMNAVVRSKPTSTGCISTKNAETGRVGSGVRQR